MASKVLCLLLLAINNQIQRTAAGPRLGKEPSMLMDHDETSDYWSRLLQQEMSVPTTTTTASTPSSSCPDSPLNLVIIGNSLNGGTSIGRVCDGNSTTRPECQLQSIPGNVRGFYQDPPEPYPSKFDRPPDSDTLIDPALPYSPKTNNHHRGDVPSKMKMLANYICSSNTFEYVQNTQSAMSTRSHSGQAAKNPQNGTLLLLDGATTATGPPYNVVVIQPQSAEYLNGATRTRVSALQELMKPRSAAAAPNVRFIVQQTWPRRESNEYNQICTTTEKDGQEEKKGMIQEIDKTLKDLLQNRELRSFEVAPTGSAFVEFAKLACGPGILPEGDCAFDSSFDCPMWFGKSGKMISLYHEEFGIEGIHQSEEIGAWLSATVLYGVIHSDTRPCYMSASDLKRILPTIPAADLARIPTGRSIPSLISDATRTALEERFGSDVVSECTPA